LTVITVSTASCASRKLVRSSRCKSGPSKRQRPLGSECCVVAGDSGREAYTAIAWGVGLSHERSDIAGPRVSIRSKATCAAPLSDVYPSRFFVTSGGLISYGA
jgi:hypothetical protein